jgi:hypothetical protein
MVRSNKACPELHGEDGKEVQAEAERSGCPGGHKSTRQRQQGGEEGKEEREQTLITVVVVVRFNPCGEGEKVQERLRLDPASKEGVYESHVRNDNDAL